jgi:nucleotide-binding universal stress UspA family protein
MKKFDIKSILVPVDLSRMSIQGIETAKRLGRRFGATIHVAHVWEPLYAKAFVAPAVAWGEFSISLAEETRKQLEQRLRTIASKCGLSPSDKTHFREGAPAFDVVCGLAAEIPADLLVVPTRASKGIKRFFLGSTAERLIQHSPCPILVDRKSAAQLSFNNSLPVGQALRIDKILVPVDFSDCSREGLRYAIEFARKFAAKITVLHVLDPGYSEPKDMRTMQHLGGFAGASVRRVLKEVRQEMRKFVRSVAFGRTKANSEITIGPPVEQISDFARANDFDLIITSTHGLTGFKHVLIGSIAEHLVRQSRVPILVVPSHPSVRAANLAGIRESRKQSRQKPGVSEGGRRISKRRRANVSRG